MTFEGLIDIILNTSALLEDNIILYELLQAISTTNNKSFLTMLNNFIDRARKSESALAGVGRGYDVIYDEKAKCYVRNSGHYLLVGDHSPSSSSITYAIESSTFVIQSYRNRIRREFSEELEGFLKEYFSDCDPIIDRLILEFEAEVFKAEPRKLLDFFKALKYEDDSYLVKEKKSITSRLEKSHLKLQVLIPTATDRKVKWGKLQEIKNNESFINHTPFSEAAKNTVKFVKEFVNNVTEEVPLEDQWAAIVKPHDLLPMQNVFPDLVANQLREIFTYPQKYLKTQTKHAKLQAIYDDLEQQHSTTLALIAECMQHKTKDYSLLEKTFMQIEKLQKDKLTKENNPLTVSFEALPSFELINSLNKNQLNSIIQACNCMTKEQREQVGDYCSKALRSSESKKVTLLSIGSYRLQQELMTAKTLMERGFDVNFILVEPCYYLDALGYDRIDYPKLKQSFDVLATEMSRAYGKSCKIVGVFPAIHFYLKMLMQSLDYSIDNKFLLKNCQQFLSFRDQNFYYYQTLQNPTDNMDYYQDLLETFPNAILIIQHANIFYWALRYDVADPKSFFIERINTPKIIEKMAVDYSTTPAPVPVQLKDHLTQQECELIQRNACIAAANQFIKQFDLLYKSQDKDNYLAVDLIPNIILAIDSNSHHMSAILSGLISFFKESFYKNGTYLNPTIFHFERSDYNPRHVRHQVTLEEENTSEVSRVPTEVLGQFSYVSSEGRRVSFFSENVIQCIADYANTENMRL